MKFWDASAVLPLCLRQSHTSRLRQITDADSVLVALWATPVECALAFARLRRDGVLSRGSEDQAKRILMQLAETWTEIEASREVRDGATRALLLHPLRAADSLQLAAALVWAGGRPAGHEFVCLDERLREAAAHEGLAVLP